MSNMINFGIDLGTTNSVIAKFVKGEVNVYKNPAGWKESTPSVIYFKKDKITVGDKARERWLKDPLNVLARFKRKMGSNESFKVAATNQTMTPIDLSALILKELKTFVPEGGVEAAVITIPASFDTIQSNATKQAGEQAGISQVVLLQEPIAASLAYANQRKEKSLKDGNWLVYDLGGGTFDVALVQIKDGEMKIVDHEGNNFLGGVDFDQLIVDELIIPNLEKKGIFSNLRARLYDSKDELNKLYYDLMYKAEMAKIELSTSTSSEIEIEIEDDEGEELNIEVKITRNDFEKLIRSRIEETIRLLNQVLINNKLSKHDIQFVLMVGGSTYIPLVQQLVSEMTGIEINREVDPTTAVGVGAAYFAGTKPLSKQSQSRQENVALRIKLAYESSTQDEDVFIAGKVLEGNWKGCTYRILRNDGGYDSGRKSLTEKFTEDLPLVAESYNFFNFYVFDGLGNPVTTDVSEIGISHGKFSVSGQPLPMDISLEVDDLEQDGTRCELIFAKNTILPVHKKLQREINRNVRRGSEDSIIINVVEGNSEASPATGYQIGQIQIKGSQLHRDLYKGSDVEIIVEMSESRDLTVTVHLNQIDQTFEQTFNPKQREVSYVSLNRQAQNLQTRLQEEIETANEQEQYERSAKLKSLASELRSLQQQIQENKNNDTDDSRYQMEDRQRKLAQEIDNLTKSKAADQARADYEKQKLETQEAVQNYGTNEEQRAFEELVIQEQAFLSSNNPKRIEQHTEELNRLHVNILWRTPSFLRGLFIFLVKENMPKYADQTQAQSLAMMGLKAIENEDWSRLREVNQALLQMLPREAQASLGQRMGQMGIS